MSQAQIDILLQFYDSLNTEMINGNIFLEHLTHKDFVGYATQLCMKNDLIPYYLQKTLSNIEEQRLSKLLSTLKEA